MTNEAQKKDSIRALQAKIHAFVEARDWRQFHSPRNLSAAIAVEASEILEHFRWTTDAQSWEIRDDAERLREVAHEMADVCILTMELAHNLEIDLGGAIEEKLAINEDRYPVEKSRGSSAKYDKL